MPTPGIDRRAFLRTAGVAGGVALAVSVLPLRLVWAAALTKAQRDRLNTYMLQARFALASIYDRAAARVAPATEHAALTGAADE